MRNYSREEIAEKLVVAWFLLSLSFAALSAGLYLLTLIAKEVRP